MRFGVLNFNVAPYERLAERWRTLEALGFDSAWLADDVVIPGYADFEAWTLLGGLASVTERMRIGTLVSPIRLRHPTFLAAQVVTLDHLSGGRAAVGIGVGEHAQNVPLGAPPWSVDETMERFEEQAAVLATLLRGDAIEHGGPRYPTTVAAMPAPVSRPRPPLVIAAHGPRGLLTTARHADIWNGLGGQPYGGGPRPTGIDGGVSLGEAVDATRRTLTKLDEACRAVGRDPATLMRSILAYRPTPEPFESLDAFDTFVGAYAELGLDEISFYWPTLDQALGDPPSPADEARFERIAAQRILARPA